MASDGKLEALERTARRFRAVDLRSFEEADPVSVANVLVPRVEALVNEAANDLAELGRIEANANVLDLAAMARLELQGVGERLRQAQGLDGPRLIAECGAAQRAVLAVLSALRQAALPEDARRAPRRTAGLARSLRLRAAYAKLRRELNSQLEPTPETTRPALALLGARLSAFTASPEFCDARVADRIELRALHDRVQQWLTTEGDAKAGARLWQDVTSCAALLSRINMRVELVEHDRELVEAAARAVSRSDAPEQMPGGLLRRLARLEGRDDAIDALLATRSLHLSAWREPVLRLHDELSPAPPHASVGEEVAF
ncbi:MAG: hypothetical protein JST54_08635 [Deltaproteobacteria bacterium]|nr:hypothetical protein [Deltaproteobacteria bacterium]